VRFVAEPERPSYPLSSRKNTIGDYTQVMGILSELVPEKEGGKYRRRNFLEYYFLFDPRKNKSCNHHCDRDLRVLKMASERYRRNRLGFNSAQDPSP
jgi:hypothetical protein